MKKENLIFVEKAMRFPEVIKLVELASDRIWRKVKDVTVFEYTCYKDIGISLTKLENVTSVGGIAQRVIARLEAKFVKYRGTIPIPSIESLAGLDEEGAEEPLEVIDVLADVEKEIIQKETYAENVVLLAEDDVRKVLILKAWTIGYHNAKELSGVLANTLGGKAESHRKCIQRFEIECKKLLKVA